ncbi:hypothetical protein PRUB_a3991 [Pseudoalteromonas rubra]|uniref:Uncharacterized protein n=1 Tax=Pseudoalteromonas rubra TaxID=43658 RepID=A0A8T0C8X9_9GAMM|nr:hypothetical protein [Pseudoalteromonas rubra]KAF7787123.1 hypothetical protein PRUB_a3991 [Pseudoalteromonas rubra]
MGKQNVILYGVNSITEQLLGTFPNATLVTTRGGELSQNRMAVSIKQIQASGIASFDKVIICSMFVDDIANTLLDAGFPLEKLFFYNIASCQIESCIDAVSPQINTDSTLYVVYDTKLNLPCYDALSFTAVAEAERKRLGLKHIHFVIIPKYSTDDKLAFCSNYPLQEHTWRIRNIVKPIFESLGSVVGVTELTSRQESKHILGDKKFIFPDDFLATDTGIAFGLAKLQQYDNIETNMPELSISAFAKQLVNNLIQSYGAENKKLLTFTFRNTQTHPERNSDTAPWQTFIEELDFDKYLPVVMRDTIECTSKPMFSDKVIELPAASINFALRLAFYDAAYINFSASSGPSFAYYFIPGCSSIRFTPVSESHFATSKSNVEKTGISTSKREQFFAHNGLHQVILEQETYESISTAFDTQISRLEGSN